MPGLPVIVYVYWNRRKLLNLLVLNQFFILVSGNHRTLKALRSLSVFSTRYRRVFLVQYIVYQWAEC